MRSAPRKRKITAILIGLFLSLVTAACALYLLSVRTASSGCIAEIYQNGRLIRTIALYQVQEPYTIEIHGEGGCVNRIEVRPGSIGVTWADCPDRLCVRQGFVRSPAIPVTCLPNKLVITLRAADPIRSAGPDMITY